MPFRKDAKMELLQSTPLFADCSKKELAAVAAIAHETEIPAGEVFIREGERGRDFFVVIEGTVDVRREGRELPLRGGTEFFGEIALIANTPRNATVTATSPVRALVVSEGDFSDLMRRLPQLQAKVLRSVGDRIGSAEVDQS